METPPKSVAEKSVSLASELPFVLVQQSIILGLAGMVLDGGGIFQVCGYALMAFWGGVAALHLRGKGILSRTDLMLIRYGFILVCVISYLLTHWIWHMRGFGKYL